MKHLAMSEIRLTEEEIEAAVAVLRSGNLRQGAESDAFEQEFAGKVGAKHAVTSANGSSALHLAYMVFLKPNDEVLVPSFTFIATASMASAAGGRPVFCDVDPETFLIDLKDAEHKLTSKTRAISPVHLFGNPADVDAVTAFAKKHHLVIVWDAAQAHGATYRGHDIGGFGDFVGYSFYPSKNMFVGEGGMTCTGNDGYAEKMRYLRSHGQTGKYYHTMLGLNYRMTDMEAAIGRRQLTRLDQMLKVRRRNAAILNAELNGINGVRLQKTTVGGEHAWHQYCLVVDPAIHRGGRDALARKLKDFGIASGVHYPRGLHQQPVFIEMYGNFSLPVTEYLAENILAVPVHHGLTEEDVRYLVKSIKESLRTDHDS
ncbi:MAG: DegT/DnrJ/EryC1/StrS family aminotransferase [Gammaproteobacteria bacterium]